MMFTVYNDEGKHTFLEYEYTFVQQYCKSIILPLNFETHLFEHVYNNTVFVFFLSLERASRDERTFRNVFFSNFFHFWRQVSSVIRFQFDRRSSFTLCLRRKLIRKNFGSVNSLISVFYCCEALLLYFEQHYCS